MLLNILICDDDIMIINKINSLLNHYFSQHSMEYLIFSSVDSAEIYESDQVFDIAYIDIEMPGINGLKLSQKLKQNNPDILIMIKNSIFRNSLIFQGLPPIKYQNLMYFPLFLPL